MLGEDFGVKKVQTINRRMFIIGAAKFIVFTGIIARLFSLQITENKKYLTLSDKNRLREWRLPPIRGEFLDYFDQMINTIFTFLLYFLFSNLFNFLENYFLGNNNVW